MCQEEEVERELHDNPPALELTNEELEYADTKESKYHTPPVVQSPILRLIHPELNAFHWGQRVMYQAVTCLVHCEFWDNELSMYLTSIL